MEINPEEVIVEDNPEASRLQGFSKALP